MFTLQDLTYNKKYDNCLRQAAKSGGGSSEALLEMEAVKEQVDKLLAVLKNEEAELKALAEGQLQLQIRTSQQRMSFKRCESRPANTRKGPRNIGRRSETNVSELTAHCMCSPRPWTASSVW